MRGRKTPRSTVGCQACRWLLPVRAARVAGARELVLFPLASRAEKV